MDANKLSIKTIIISYLIFLSGWSLRVYCINLSGMNEIMCWAIGFLIHTLWWPVFALALIKKYSDKLNVSMKEMLLTRPKIKILILPLLFAVVYNVIGFLTDGDSFGTDMKAYDLVVTVLTVGFYEEIVFRGWFLNAISSFAGERKANLISSVLFVLIHYPGWIHNGYDWGTILSLSLFMYPLSLLFGWLFRKNRSIWSGAILHSVWDMLTWVL